MDGENFGLKTKKNVSQEDTQKNARRAPLRGTLKENASHIVLNFMLIFEKSNSDFAWHGRSAENETSKVSASNLYLFSFKFLSTPCNLPLKWHVS